ncbi:MULTISPECIES: hypothetical protein [Streptomyces]|uniref:hypothetical protein n=1 Tax=Streptomyces TaxID=1883 RepID=UPI001EE655D8|nr:MULTISPECIES: hypothetical protein [Streptomyces]
MDARSRKSQAVFACTVCGHRDHADVNAAKNQRDAGRVPSLWRPRHQPVREAGTRKSANRPTPLRRGIPVIHDGEDVNSG